MKISITKIGSQLANWFNSLSRFWLISSLIAFAIATLLTYRIAYVNRVMDAVPHNGTILAEPTGWYTFAALAEPQTRGVAEMLFDYSIGDDWAVLTLRLPSGVKKLRVWNLFSPSGCHYFGKGDESPVGSPLGDVRDSDNAFWATVDLSGVALDEGHRIVCNVKPQWLRETFTTTVSAFYNSSRGEVKDREGQIQVWDAVKDNQGQVLSAIPIELAINNRPGSFEVAASGSMIQEGKNVINPSQFAVVRFRSIREEQIRDWYLVLIGAFVALGAACLVELARPLAEGSKRNGG